jgi:hypothetical protein
LRELHRLSDGLRDIEAPVGQEAVHLVPEPPEQAGAHAWLHLTQAFAPVHQLVSGCQHKGHLDRCIAWLGAPAVAEQFETSANRIVSFLPGMKTIQFLESY